MPQNPRKSRFGRFTYCTGSRRSIRLRSDAMCTVSSRRSSVSPWYQGMRALGSTRLSPFSADIGMKRRSRMSSRVAKRRVVGADLVEARLRPVDEVHLVDGDDDVADPQQRDDEAVTTRLPLHAVPRVDQDDRQVAVRRARRHVARVLLVARTVGDDELAPARREVAVRDVDRDALLALGLEAVHQQRQIDLAARRPLPLAVALTAAS